MESNCILSLIICTYQRPQPIKNLLLSIRDQNRLPDEILIVDSSQEDATQAVIQDLNELKLPIQYIKVSAEQRGLTRQRNVGISFAKGEIIAFLDDDTILSPSYFTEILACFERHLDVIGVGGTITNEIYWRKVENPSRSAGISVFRWQNWERDEDLRNQMRKRLGLISLLPPGWMPPFGHGRSAIYPPDGTDYLVEFIMGGASAWRRGIFSKYLFSNYFQNYGLYEDLDFCIRAGKSGTIYLCTAAQLEHHHAASGRPNPFRYGQMVTRNGWFVWRRCYPQPGFKNQNKWWTISLLLAFFRLLDFRDRGFIEAFGRFWGSLTLLWDLPQENE